MLQKFLTHLSMNQTMKAMSAHGGTYGTTVASLSKR